MDTESRQPMNAREAWPPMDTVLIGDGQGDINNAKWYNTFLALSREEKISFFNVRNRSIVGPMYNNMDAKESMPYAFQLYSLGVQFWSPALNPVTAYSYDGTTLVGPTCDNATNVHAQFAGELLKHSSLRLQVSQDEKVIANSLAFPAGFGVSGIMNVDTSDTTTGAELGAVQALSNGIPSISNRFGFPEPVSIPRNCIFNVELQFSTYGRALLERMEGPGRVMIQMAPGETWDLEDATVPAICGIKVVMFGRRFVQQRNELHFS